MTTNLIELHPEAMSEARSIRLWYSSHGTRASDAFMLELDYAFERIVESPNRWPRFLHGTRRYLLRRYPYSIVYRMKPTAIEVLAVAHNRKRPGYWAHRK
jgi:plasmid stabilization system protein ParE